MCAQKHPVLKPSRTNHSRTIQQIFDITVPIHSKMVVWPGDPPVSVETVLDVCCGDVATVRRLNLGSHTGTHVDAFSHFQPKGKNLDEMDLSIYIGPARLIEVPQDIKIITAEVLKDLGVENSESFWPDETRRLILKTANSQTDWSLEPFQEQFVHLSPDAAVYLVACGVQLIGVDYLSVEGYFAQNAPTHHQLMDAGVYIIEGLALQAVSAGGYELICLPLKIQDGDGAPARVVLRTLNIETQSEA
jgi:arylformamidase